MYNTDKYAEARTDREKIYFNPGDKVKLRKLETPGEMLVKAVPKAWEVNGEGRSLLIGITCYWFTTDGTYQESTFNSKDLIKIGE